MRTDAGEGGVYLATYSAVRNKTNDFSAIKILISAGNTECCKSGKYTKPKGDFMGWIYKFNNFCSKILEISKKKK